MSNTPRRRVLRFTAPKSIAVDTEPAPPPEPGEVEVQTVLSAVSPGTEKLVYRGEAPSTLSADADIPALSGELEFPITYGYAAVGRVTRVGESVSTDWSGRRVFAFQPHTSQFTAAPEALIPLPEAVSFADGVLIPNVETAVNFAMDGAPILGERIVIFGQGVVGLLTTALISRHPVAKLYTVEPDPTRRSRSEALGADRSFAPGETPELADALHVQHRDATEVEGDTYEGADLIFELSGKPDVVNQALSIAGYDARIVLGSWYGTREAPIDLGGRFHRSRVDLVSSQVSSIAPTHRGRWSKGRRMLVVLRLLPTLAPSSLIAEEFSLEEADEVFRRLDQGDLLQPVFRYD